MKIKLNTLFLILLLFISYTTTVNACKTLEHPNCTGAEQWATSMAYVHLKNTKKINSQTLDLSKTQVNRLASEKIGDDLYTQVHHIIFLKKLGQKIEVITRNDASSKECSMSNVDVFVIDNTILE